MGVGAHRVRKRAHRPKKSAHIVWGSVSDSKIKVFPQKKSHGLDFFSPAALIIVFLTIVMIMNTSVE